MWIGVDEELQDKRVILTTRDAGMIKKQDGETL